VEVRLDGAGGRRPHRETYAPPRTESEGSPLGASFLGPALERERRVVRVGVAGLGRGRGSGASFAAPAVDPMGQERRNRAPAAAQPG